MTTRWCIEHYGKDYDNWSVYEAPSGGRPEPFPPILTWLTERQAVAIADFLNDVAGYDWQARHSDWWNEATALRASERGDPMSDKRYRVYVQPEHLSGEHEEYYLGGYDTFAEVLKSLEGANKPDLALGFTMLKWVASIYWRNPKGIYILARHVWLSSRSHYEDSGDYPHHGYIDGNPDRKDE